MADIKNNFLNYWSKQLKKELHDTIVNSPKYFTLSQSHATHQLPDGKSFIAIFLLLCTSPIFLNNREIRE